MHTGVPSGICLGDQALIREVSIRGGPKHELALVNVLPDHLHISAVSKKRIAVISPTIPQRDTVPR